MEKIHRVQCHLHACRHQGFEVVSTCLFELQKRVDAHILSHRHDICERCDSTAFPSPVTGTVFFQRHCGPGHTEIDHFRTCHFYLNQIWIIKWPWAVKCRHCRLFSRCFSVKLHAASRFPSYIWASAAVSHLFGSWETLKVQCSSSIAFFSCPWPRLV